MKQKKKIVHIVESFASGVFSFLVDLIADTAEEYDITILYGEREETLPNFKDYFDASVKFIKIENFTRSISLKKDINAYFEIRRQIKEIQPDVVHLHSSKAGILGRLAISGKKVKMLYNPHGFSFLKEDDSKLKRMLYKTIEKIATIRTCTIVGCSEGEYQEARKLTKNAVCISNGINTEKLEKEIRDLPEKKLDTSRWKICTSGRIGYQKNPALFNQIAENFPEIEFTWIGEGELRNTLTSSNIQVTGWKTREEVLKLVNENDIFVLTSLWEGLPISLLEAMYLKKICIASNCIGNRDVIQNGENGFIANNIEEYKKIIQQIQENKIEKERVTNNAFASVEEEYNVKKMAEQYRKIYHAK